MANNATGLTRIFKAAGYSWKGLRAAWRHEAAFRQEAAAAILAVVIAGLLDVDAITRVLLIGSVILVIVEAKVDGSSRFSNRNQRVSLHYTQRENLFQLWRSLRFGGNLQSWVEDNASLPVHKEKSHESPD